MHASVVQHWRVRICHAGGGPHIGPLARRHRVRRAYTCIGRSCRGMLASQAADIYICIIEQTTVSLAYLPIHLCAAAAAVIGLLLHGLIWSPIGLLLQALLLHQSVLLIACRSVIAPAGCVP